MPKHLSRKEFLQRLTLLSAGLVGPALLSSCSLFDEPEMKVCLLEDLKGKPYLISRFNRKKILVRHLEEELVIFSLICSHKRCTVAYEADTQEFACPCHEGRYDQYGEVLDGPPPAPLSRYKGEVRGNEVWVLNQWI